MRKIRCIVHKNDAVCQRCKVNRFECHFPEPAAKRARRLRALQHQPPLPLSVIGPPLISQAAAASAGPGPAPNGVSHRDPVQLENMSTHAVYCKYLEPMTPFVPAPLFMAAMEDELFSKIVRLAATATAHLVPSCHSTLWSVVTSAFSLPSWSERSARAFCMLALHVELPPGGVELVHERASVLTKQPGANAAGAQGCFSLVEVVAIADTWAAFMATPPRAPRGPFFLITQTEPSVLLFALLTRLVNNLLVLNYRDDHEVARFETDALQLSTTHPVLMAPLDMDPGPEHYDEVFLHVVYCAMLLRFYNAALGNKMAGIAPSGGMFNFIMIVSRSIVLSLCKRHVRILSQWLPARTALCTAVEISMRLAVQYKHLGSQETLAVFYNLVGPSSHGVKDTEGATEAAQAWEGVTNLAHWVRDQASKDWHIGNEELAGLASFGYWMFHDVRLMNHRGASTT